MSALGLRYLSERNGKEAQNLGLLAESVYRSLPASPKSKRTSGLKPPSGGFKKAPESLSESYEKAVERYKEERERRS